MRARFRSCGECCVSWLLELNFPNLVCNGVWDEMGLSFFCFHCSWCFWLTIACNAVCSDDGNGNKKDFELILLCCMTKKKSFVFPFEVYKVCQEFLNMKTSICGGSLLSSIVTLNFGSISRMLNSPPLPLQCLKKKKRRRVEWSSAHWRVSFFSRAIGCSTILLLQPTFW